MLFETGSYFQCFTRGINGEMGRGRGKEEEGGGKKERSVPLSNMGRRTKKRLCIENSDLVVLTDGF